MTGIKKVRALSCAIASVVAVVALAGCNIDDTATSGSGDSGSSGQGSGGSQEKTSLYTTAQQQAIKSAQNYLSMGSGFSRAGLFRQLTLKAGEGFKKADANFALNHIKVDYNKQAVLSAKSYLSTPDRSLGPA